MRDGSVAKVSGAGLIVAGTGWDESSLASVGTADRCCPADDLLLVPLLLACTLGAASLFVPELFSAVGLSARHLVPVEQLPRLSGRRTHIPHAVIAVTTSPLLLALLAPGSESSSTCYFASSRHTVLKSRSWRIHAIIRCRSTPAPDRKVPLNAKFGSRFFGQFYQRLLSRALTSSTTLSVTRDSI